MWDYCGIVLYVLLMLTMAILTRRTPKFLEFSLAGRRLPYFLIFASLSSTYIGPGFSIGASDRGFQTGFLYFFLFLPFALQTFIVGIFLAPRLAAMRNCTSIGDTMGQLYGRFTHLLTGISSVGICIMFTAFLAKVAGETVATFTGLPFAAGVAIVTALSVSYTFYGGIKASVLTDSIQFVVFTLIIPLIAILALFHSSFDISEASRIAVSNTKESFSELPFITALGVALSFFLGETLIPPYANRALASKSPKASTRSFILASVFCVFWLFSVTGIGLSYGIVSAEVKGDGALLGLAEIVLPSGLWGMLLISIIGIIMSSQDSVLNAGAVSFTRDIVNILPRFSGIMSESGHMLVGRLATLLIGIVGAISAAWLPSIIDALVLIYSIWAPTILLPLAMGLLIKKPPRHAGWLSILAGGTTSILWRHLYEESTNIPSILPALGIAAVAYCVGIIISRNTNNSKEH